jgi:hypothetical protein
VDGLGQRKLTESPENRGSVAGAEYTANQRHVKEPAGEKPHRLASIVVAGFLPAIHHRRAAPREFAQAAIMACGHDTKRR